MKYEYRCEKCGRMYEYMPSYGICSECGGRVGVRMVPVGFVRHSAEEGDIYLFQCPKCKSVVLSSEIEEVCFCGEVNK